jgi:arylsulfatase A-like enzyme
MFGCEATPPPAPPALQPATQIPALNSQTNVLLVVFDTTRAQQMGAWGYPLNTTPILDKLAAKGVRFENFYANSSWTRPGFASIFTGRYARSVGIYEERFDRLPEDVTTLTEHLQTQGYLTLGVTSNPNTNQIFGFAQGFDDYRDSVANWKWMAEAATKPMVGDGKAPHETATEVNQRVGELLDAHAEAITQQPFFLHLVYMEPHTPRYPSERHLKALQAEAMALNPPLGRSKVVRKYDAELRTADEAFGQLLTSMAGRNLLDNTLIVVVSDHGEGLSSNPEYPGSKGHGHYLSEALLRVPLILHHPSLPTGLVVPDLTSTVDLMPTIAGLLGAPIDNIPVDGRSLVPVITAKPNAQSPIFPVYSETEMGPFNKLSVRTQTHALIQNEDARLFQQSGAHEQLKLKLKLQQKLEQVPPTELYLRAQIEAPSQNRVLTETQTAAQLSEKLVQFEKQFPRRTPLNRSKQDVMVLSDGSVVPAVDQGVDMALSDEMKAQLRALGYLGD